MLGFFGEAPMEKSIFSAEYEVFLTVLRRRRKNAGLTQEDMAAALGTTQSVISKCERGERRLDVIELRRWCSALGVGLGAFVRELEKNLGDGRRKLR